MVDSHLSFPFYMWVATKKNSNWLPEKNLFEVMFIKVDSTSVAKTLKLSQNFRTPEYEKAFFFPLHLLSSNVMVSFIFSYFVFRTCKVVCRSHSYLGPIFRKLFNRKCSSFNFYRGVWRLNWKYFLSGN